MFTPKRLLKELVWGRNVGWLDYIEIQQSGKMAFWYVQQTKGRQKGNKILQTGCSSKEILHEKCLWNNVQVMLNLCLTVYFVEKWKQKSADVN